MSNIELANYNQTTIFCKYCPSEVKRSKMPFHVSKCHKDEYLKEHAPRQEVEYQFPDTLSRVPERPICHIVPNQDTENWDDSNRSTYNPLLATAHKPIMRGNYYQGYSKQEKKRCREFEIERMAQIRETSLSENFETSYQTESFASVPELEIDNTINDSSEESWSESSLSVYSTRSDSFEDSFFTCNSRGTNTSNAENASSFELSMAEYLRNLSDERRAEVIQKFSKIMREQ